MIKVFTNPNGFIVANIRNLLALEGIQTEIRNEFAVGATGELAYVDVWPELWVADWCEEKARQLISAFGSEEISGVWCCCSCREENEAAFDLCWQCGEDRASW
ncbi:DUF2007 domain-containing protein [Litoribrevibacter euphylliae]|uniref:DUF2007 domain-containing protein n=1 Tax=Litoribrevibacter euphylliae TaxID=1834034 RepID=A0ABV7HGF2_9GAMM